MPYFRAAAVRPYIPGRVDLRTRRRWYDETPPPADASNTPPPNQPPPAQTGETDESWRIEDLPDGVQRYIRELRAEAADRRKKLQALEDERRQSDQRRLEEEGRFRELAEARAKELDALKPYRERVEALEKMLADTNKAKIERLPEHMRSLVPTDYSPERLASWLDNNWDRLTVPPAPPLDAGAGSGGRPPASLTAEEAEMAKRFGITPEQYAKRKAELGGNS